MKKTKFVALALVLCLALMGTAFAWWTQSTTINATVDTGNLKLVMENAKSSTGFYKIKDMKPITFDKDSNDVDINSYSAKAEAKINDQNGGDLLTATMTNLFPGAYASFSFQVNNTGTVPVRIDNVKLTIDKTATTLNESDYNNLLIRFSYALCDKTGKILKGNDGKEKSYYLESKLPNIANDIYESLKNVELVPGDYLVVNKTGINGASGTYENGLEIFVPTNWENGTEDKNLQFSLEFNYIQANAK